VPTRKREGKAQKQTRKPKIQKKNYHCGRSIPRKVSRKKEGEKSDLISYAKKNETSGQASATHAKGL